MAHTRYDSRSNIIYIIHGFLWSTNIIWHFIYFFGTSVKEIIHEISLASPVNNSSCKYLIFCFYLWFMAWMHKNKCSHYTVCIINHLPIFSSLKNLQGVPGPRNKATRPIVARITQLTWITWLTWFLKRTSHT